VLLASPPLGFFLDDRHGDAHQAIELVGAGLGKQTFAPRPSRWPKLSRSRRMNESRATRSSSIAPQLVTRLVRPLGEPLIAMGVAQALA